MNKEITAVLFSGGQGTRLFPLNRFSQKVMMPIGRYGTPIIEVVIRHLMHYGVKNFLILIQYRGNQIKRYLKKMDNLNIEILYSVDNPKLKGTGGALLNAEKLISTNNFLTYFTDILTSLNLTRFLEYHYKKKKGVTVWLDPHPKDQGTIVQFNEQGLATKIDVKKSSNLVNTGISLCNKSLFNLFNTETTKQKGTLDFSGDIIPKLVELQSVQGYISPEWWIDIGSLHRYSNLHPSLLARQFNHLLKEEVL